MKVEKWFPVSAFLMKGHRNAVAIFASVMMADEYAQLHPEYQRIDYYTSNLDFMLFNHGEN